MLAGMRQESSKQPHAAFFDYMVGGVAEEEEDVPLRLPWITPRRRPDENEERKARRKSQHTKSSAPADVTKYRAANLPASIIKTSVPHIDNFIPSNNAVVDVLGLSPRYKPGCKACGDSVDRQHCRRRAKMLGEVSRLASKSLQEAESVSSLSERSPRTKVGVERGVDVAMDSVMWSLAREVLASDGVKHDEAMRPFFVDKFTRARVYMLQHLEHQHDRSLYDTKCSAPSRRSTGAPSVSHPAPGVSHPQTQKQVSAATKASSHLHQDLSALKDALTGQHTSLDLRMQDLVTLKTDALKHAAQLAAQDRSCFEVQVQWEMLRLDSEIEKIAERLQKCSQVLSVADPSWSHDDCSLAQSEHVVLGVDGERVGPLRENVWAAHNASHKRLPRFGGVASPGQVSPIETPPTS